MSHKLLVAWNINPALRPAAGYATKNVLVQVISSFKLARILFEAAAQPTTRTVNAKADQC
jgi:hypothetical protein